MSRHFCKLSWRVAYLNTGTFKRYKLKGKISLHVIKNQNKKLYSGGGIQSHSFFISALDGDQWLPP
jgi:hypothetical protein